MTTPLVTTISKTEWAIRTVDSEGRVALHLMYQPGWGTRFQDPPIPYTRETAERALNHTSQFGNRSYYKEAAVVSRESVTVSTEWVAEPDAPLTRTGWKALDNEGFANYCNTCGRSNGTHSYHCNNDR